MPHAPRDDQILQGLPALAGSGSAVRAALRMAGVAGAIVIQESVETIEDAVRTGFPGSPTILVDGEDPFAEAGAPVGLACRLYRTEMGPQGAPTLETTDYGVRTEEVMTRAPPESRRGGGRPRCDESQPSRG
jgi:hypothetical protein